MIKSKKNMSNSSIYYYITHKKSRCVSLYAFLKLHRCILEKTLGLKKTSEKNGRFKNRVCLSSTRKPSESIAYLTIFP